MAGKKNPYHYDPDYYVHGSTVRKLNTAERARAPERKEREYDLPRRERSAPPPARKKVPQRESDRYERLREQEAQRDEKRLFSITRSIGFFG
ncbi:MAG: hypothetical protein K2O71_07110, partial [Lachnospiraceae bacterium]|nr:hypothetical protein [Lachnospiraceae bacterium]